MADTAVTIGILTQLVDQRDDLNPGSYTPGQPLVPYISIHKGRPTAVFTNQATTANSSVLDVGGHNDLSIQVLFSVGGAVTLQVLDGVASAGTFSQAQDINANPRQFIQSGSYIVHKVMPFVQILITALSTAIVTVNVTPLP